LLDKRLIGVETKITGFTSTLEHFLGQIQIDDRLRLVPDTRTIRGPPEDSLDVFPTCSASIIDLSTGSDTEGEAVSNPVDVDVDVDTKGAEGGEDEDFPMIPSPIAATVTTPSEFQDDERMEMVEHLRLSPLPPKPAHPSPDVAMAPPSHPAVNIIPATPQQSQEAGRQGAGQQGAETLEPGEIPDAAPQLRVRACSRTPFGLPPVASSSRLEPPTTRSRSRSKTPAERG